MKSLIKKIAFTLCDKKISQLTLPVFLIHGILDNPKALFQKSFDSASTENFYQSLSFLKQYLDFIPLSQSLFDAKNGKDLTGKCILTFDDAYSGLKDNAFPILEDLNIPATVFIISDVIDDKKVFWRDQIRYLNILCKTDELKAYILNGIDNNKHKEELEKLDIYKWCKVNPNHLSSYTVAEGVAAYCQDNRITLPDNHQDNCANFFFTKEDILQASPLIEFGNHTASHPIMPSLSLEQQYLEIKLCQDFLRPFSNALTETLCLPFGMSNDDTYKAAKKADVSTVLHHSNTIINKSSNLSNGVIDRCNLPLNKENFLISVIKESFAS